MELGRKGGRWQILKDFEDLVSAGGGRGREVKMGLETEALANPRGGSAYQVSRDSSGDEGIRAVDQGSTGKQHY